jgi:hypothetical protein
VIGLCRGLAFRAYMEIPQTYFSWDMVKDMETFGLIASRSSIACQEEYIPTSMRYFELLEACPLRMSTGLGEGTAL